MTRQRSRIVSGLKLILNNYTVADTNLHDVDISSHVPRLCIGVFIMARVRVGVDSIYAYTRPTSAGDIIQEFGAYTECAYVGIENQKLTLALETANDEHDVYMQAYVMREKTTSDRK